MQSRDFLLIPPLKVLSNPLRWQQCRFEVTARKWRELLPLLYSMLSLCPSPPGRGPSARNQARLFLHLWTPCVILEVLLHPIHSGPVSGSGFPPHHLLWLRILGQNSSKNLVTSRALIQASGSVGESIGWGRGCLSSGNSGRVWTSPLMRFQFSSFR